MGLRGVEAPDRLQETGVCQALNRRLYQLMRSWYTNAAGDAAARAWQAAIARVSGWDGYEGDVFDDGPVTDHRLFPEEYVSPAVACRLMEEPWRAIGLALMDIYRAGCVPLGYCPASETRPDGWRRESASFLIYVPPAE